MTDNIGGNHTVGRRWTGTAATGALVGLGLLVLWRSLVDLPLGTLSDPGPGAAPVLLACLLIACAVWGALGGGAALLPAEDGDEGAATEPVGTEPGALRHALLLFASTILAAFALGPLGYRLTILALLLFFVGLVGRRPLVTTLLLSFGLAFGSYWVFDHLLKVPLPTGPFGL